MSRIMVVDDSNFMRLFIKNMVKTIGHEIVGEANCGEEAIGQYIKLKPDLVFMDITMPGMPGINAVKEIIKLDKDARIVMCSAIGQEIIIKEALHAGAKDFIAKPFQLCDIKKSIEKYAKK